MFGKISEIWDISKIMAHLTVTNGYEAYRDDGDGFYIHRLVAVAKFGFDAVCGDVAFRGGKE